jgi:hypothetical protein
MGSEARQLADLVLDAASKKLTKTEDGRYYHRTSAVSRCLRDMVLHSLGEPWSNPPDPKWGDSFRFDQGHDVEDRVIQYLKDAGITVTCQQMTVQATTPRGKPVLGHIDGIILIPEGMPLGGKWYMMDVKSAGAFPYKMVLEADQAKPEHIRQISVYCESVVADKDYPEVSGFKVRDLVFSGYEFGGGLVAYFAIDRPTTGYGNKKEDQPKIHCVQFDIDPMDVEVYLDIFDEVDIHKENGTIPHIPSQSDEMVWGRRQKDGTYKAARCAARWCRRYDVCQGHEEPINPEVKEILWQR